MKGALEKGHQVEKIRVGEKKIGYCTACYACKDTGICSIKDDMACSGKSGVFLFY